MKPGTGRTIRLGRRAVVPMLALWLLAGCTAAEQVPQWSARPGYYAPQPPPYYVEPSPAYEQAPLYYANPAPRPRYVRPAPPVPDEPQQADVAPPVPVAPPTYEPGDPCVGWWRVCHLWD
jgi:hypothetical protein